MVTLGEAVQDEVVSDKSQQRKSLDSGLHESQSNPEGSTPVFPEKEVDELSKTSPNAEFSASRRNEGGNTLSSTSEEVSDNVQQRKKSDNTSRDQRSHSSREGKPVSTIPVRVLQKQSPDRTSGDHTSEANREGNSSSQLPEKVLHSLQHNQRSDSGVHTSQSNKKGSSLSAIPEKVPNTGSHIVQCNQEGRSSPRIPDKASEDGYNWRKYGQKLVKGNEFVRSYYRCTHPNCPAKRQVERSQGGQITDTVYLGKHEHPKPQPSPQIAVGLVMPIQAKRQDEPSSLAIADDKSSHAHVPTSHPAKPMEAPRLPSIPPSDGAVEGAISPSNRTKDEVDHSGNLDSKRQKRDISHISETLVEKPNGESRMVVQTMSEVDIVNDGYRWRKYGQKFVKGNANPRSYYRCSNAGCPVKKHVERASHDPKVVITTYEGQHVHDMPPARTVTVNTAGANTNTASLNGESREEKGTVGLELVVHSTAN